MDHWFNFIAKAFLFIETFVESRQVDPQKMQRWPERVIKITYVMCSGMEFADFVTVQCLSHISSFVKTVLTCQEVVLSEVCMGCLQFLVRSVILQFSSWHLWRRSPWERHCRIMARVILAYSSFLKLMSVRDMAPICCILISSSRDDMISNRKARLGIFESQQ